jgi:hypothetical protein
MRGHIRRRRQKWAVVVEIGKAEDGRRRQKWYSGFATRREAQAHLTEVLGQLDKGVYVAPTKQTVAEYLLEWLQARRP